MRTILAAFAAATLAFPLAGGAAGAADASADSVLATAARALGAGNLKNLPSFRESATGMAVGLHATAVQYTDLAHGGTFAQYANLGLFTEDQGYDGSAAWTRDSKGVVWVDGSQQGHASSLNEAYRESYALWTPAHGGAAVALLPPQSQGGKSFDVVHVTPPGSVVPFDVWIDRTSHLPERYVETAAAVTTTTLLSDYHVVAGVELPFGSKQTTSQGNEIDFQVTHIDVAPPDLAAKVRKPETDVHDYSIEGANETSLPFDLIDNHIYLDLTLNGKGPFRFVLDTGGSNVVDPAVAREIGATAQGSAQGGGVGATTEEASFTTVSSMRIGKAVLKDQLFATLPVRAGFGVAGSAPVDGIIGAEVFARFVTVIDYSAKRLTLKLPSAPISGKATPFVFSGTQPEVACQIDQIATQCTIDTGSRSSLDLYAPFVAEHPAVVPAQTTQAGLNGFGVGGGDVGRLGRLPSLEIGGFKLENLVAGFSGASAGAFAVPGIGANVGGGVFKRFTVTFDYPHQTMSLEPNVSLGAADQYERSGMFLVNQGKLIVADVRPGTPAAKAGIVKGDVIESIDGVPAAQLNLGSAREAFRRAPGTQVKVVVLEKGAATPRALTVTLNDYV